MASDTSNRPDEPHISIRRHRPPVPLFSENNEDKQQNVRVISLSRAAVTEAFGSANFGRLRDPPKQFHSDSVQTLPPSSRSMHFKAQEQGTSGDDGDMLSVSVATQSKSRITGPRIKEENEKERAKVRTMPRPPVSSWGTGGDSGSPVQFSDATAPAQLLTPKVEVRAAGLSAPTLGPDKTTPDQTFHTIFCLDGSGSMRQQGRMHESFECVISFLKEQMANVAPAVRQLFSLLTFKEEAKVHFTSKSLSKGLIASVRNIKEAFKPSHGTTFACALEEVLRIITMGDREDQDRAAVVAIKKEPGAGTWEEDVCAHGDSVATKYLVVFLSDGRPGDQQEKETYKFKGLVQRSATTLITLLTTTLKERLQFFAVGIGAKAESKWLERLAHIVDQTEAMGRFIYSANVVAPPQQDLTAGNQVIVGTASKTKSSATKAPSSSSSSSSSSSAVPDSDVQFVVPMAKPKARVIDLTQSQTSVTASSLVEAFGSISSQLTLTLSSTVAGRGGAGAHKQERSVCFEPPDEWRRDLHGHDAKVYAAHKMVLNTRRQTPTFEAEAMERRVALRNRPFSSGAERNAYHMHDETEEEMEANGFQAVHYVAKESRILEHFNDRLKFHMPVVQAQTLAANMANAFNRAVQATGSFVPTLGEYIPPISMIPCSVFRLRDEAAGGGFRYLSAEPFINGEFIKFNSNNGYVNPSPHLGNLVAQAFSHWSYQHSLKICRAKNLSTASTGSGTGSGSAADIDEPFLVCDIQGTNFCFTDPSICTVTGRRYGKADVGNSGIMKFLSHHDCNAVCEHLRLPVPGVLV